jgi:hypothetical protein
VNIPRTIALDPGVLSEDETVKKFTEVLNHVVPLRFPVDKDIQANALLEAHDMLDFFLNELFIFILGEFTFVKLGTGLTNLLGLLNIVH